MRHIHVAVEIVPLTSVTLVLTWQRQGAEAGGECLAQRLQMLVEKAVSSPLLQHVAF